MATGTKDFIGYTPTNGNSGSTTINVTTGKNTSIERSTNLKIQGKGITKTVSINQKSNSLMVQINAYGYIENGNLYYITDNDGNEYTSRDLINVSINNQNNCYLTLNIKIPYVASASNGDYLEFYFVNNNIVNEQNILSEKVFQGEVVNSNQYIIHNIESTEPSINDYGGVVILQFENGVTLHIDLQVVYN